MEGMCIAAVGAVVGSNGLAGLQRARRTQFHRRLTYLAIRLNAVLQAEQL